MKRFKMILVFLFLIVVTTNSLSADDAEIAIKLNKYFKISKSMTYYTVNISGITKAKTEEFYIKGGFFVILYKWVQADEIDTYNIPIDKIKVIQFREATNPNNPD